MATHSSTLAWKIPWTEEPGKLKSMGSQRVKHDRATENKHKINCILRFQIYAIKLRKGKGVKGWGLTWAKGGWEG